MKYIAKFRRRKSAPLLVLFFALGFVSIIFSAVNVLVSPAQARIGTDETLVDKGSVLFAEGCSSCHGLNGQGTSDGPTLVGVGAASVHFQVSTGRMPMVPCSRRLDSIHVCFYLNCQYLRLQQ